jgi:glycosyltransferase involved in cell wall biosynthesis
MTEYADVVVVPSVAARERLLELGAPLGGDVRVVPHVIRDFVEAPRSTSDGPAIVASRLAAEKGVDTAIDACRAVGLPLVVAGDGPIASELRARAAGADVRFVGRVDAEELARLRASASVAIVPSRSAETFGWPPLRPWPPGCPSLRRGSAR